MNEQIKKILKNNSMNLFILLASYFLLILLFYTTFQILNIKRTLSLIQILSIVIPIIVYLLIDKPRKNLKPTIVIICIYLFLILILPFAYSKTYDLTIDGNTYHKTAIAFIKNGWNPLYEDSIEFQEKNPEKIVSFKKEDRLDKWIDHYPKATWIIAAVIYEFTGSIESGKCITLIFTIMLFIISYNCLSIILSRNRALVCSLLIALNPITLSQLFSYYVDSLMGIFFTIELLLLFMINPMKKQNIFIWIMLTSICAIFVNLKYTGLLASGVLAAVFYFYWLIKYHKEKDFWIRFRNITVHFIVVFSIAIFLVGSNSYVKNTIEHQNPLYPLIGKGKVDIITTMQPKSFNHKNMIEKFMISIFSKTENVTYTMKPTPKLPFQVYKSELEALRASDVRIGGFGPLFGLVIITTIIVLGYSLAIFIKHEKKNIRYITLPIIAIFLSMILLGENWWARYVPQLYLIVVGTLILTMYVQKYVEKKLVIKIAEIIFACAIVLNICCFIPANVQALKDFLGIHRDIQEMKNTKDLKLKLGLDGLYGYYYTLNDEDVKYEVVKDIDSNHQRYIYCWRLVVEDK